MVAPLLLLLALQGLPADSLLARAGTAPTATLVAQTRADPLTTRDAVATAVRRGAFPVAERLALAYAEAWQDSFFVREVGRIARWPVARQRARLDADSIRRLAVTVYARDGAAAAITLWRTALGRAINIPDSVLAGAIAGNIGAGFVRLGQSDSATKYLARAVQFSRKLGDRRVEANATTLLGTLAEDRGDLAGARNEYRRAIDLHTRIGDRRGVAAGRNNLGLLAWRTGDVAEAQSQFTTALAINREDGREEIAATNLVNLAGLASQGGEFALGQQLYQEALTIWRPREAWADVVDALSGLGQLALRRGDYPTARRTLTEALALVVRTGPVTTELQIRRSLASALAAQGELQGALDGVRAADDIARLQAAAPVDQAGLALTRADLLLQLNELADAESWYQRAEGLFRDAGRSDEEAAARHGRGLVRLANNDLPGAQQLLVSALRSQAGGADRRAAGLTRLALGELERARGDSAAAQRYLTEAAQNFDQLGDPVAGAVALGELAGLSADANRPAAAEAGYRRALAKLQDRNAPDVAWPLYAGLAKARGVRGALADAVAMQRLAVAQVERVSASLLLPERSAAYRADKRDVYVQLALLERARQNTGAAFEASERLRAREMLELLGRGRIDDPADARVAGLAGREQDLRRYIAETTSQLEGAAAGPLRGPPLVNAGGVAREAMLAAQGAYSDLLLEIRERAPRHNDLITAATASWRDVARGLRRDEALVEYLMSDATTIAFVVTRDTLVAVDLAVGQQELARLVEFARGTVDVPPANNDSTWRVPFRRLHRQLIAPLEESGALRGITRLVIVPHAELHYLPFAALLSERGVLIQQYQLAFTPSASVWLALGRRTTTGRPSGILAMAPLPAALPGSRREVEGVPQRPGEAVTVRIGSWATELEFRREAPGKRILHLASYGVLNKHNPLFSFVEFAPDDGNDGRLEVHEVFGLTLNADLVILSACQTAAGSGRIADVPPGDDWVGLTRAFFHAGARRVMAALWPIEDRATATLMGAFYVQGGAGTDPDHALATAQRGLASGGALRHPYFWAGVVMAEGRGE